MSDLDDLIKRLRDYSSFVKAGAYNGNDDFRVATLNAAADRLQATKEPLVIEHKEKSRKTG